MFKFKNNKGDDYWNTPIVIRGKFSKIMFYIMVPTSVMWFINIFVMVGYWIR